MNKEYIIRDNETLRDIARKELGDENLWVKIALLNNLVFPYIGTAQSGDISYPKNLLSWSEEFDKDVWVKTSGAFVWKNEVSAPNGLLTGSRIIVNPVSDPTVNIKQTISGLLTSKRYEPSIFLQKITTTGLLPLKNFGGKGYWLIDLSRCSNSWEKLTRDNPVVVVMEEFESNASGECSVGFGSNETVFTEFYVFGAQLEVGLISTNYVRTQNFDQQYLSYGGNQSGRVAGIGEKILLPYDDIQDEKTYYSQRNLTQEDYETLILGVDIGLTDKKLYLSAGHDGVDFLLKRGRDNIVQAVSHKFMVKKGSLPYHKSYGTLIQEYIGQELDYKQLERVKVEGVRTVLEDMRVEQISKVTASVSEQQLDQVDLEIQANLVGNLVSSIKVKIDAEGVQL